MPALPPARGATSAFLIDALRRAPHALEPFARPPVEGDPLADDDLQLALYLCYELHYHGLDGVDERWEWEPSLLAAGGAERQRRVGSDGDLRDVVADLADRLLDDTGNARS